MDDKKSTWEDKSPKRPAEFDVDYMDQNHLAAFEKALQATPESHPEAFISAESDWRPIRQKIQKKKKRRPRKDETREGFVYGLLKWPLLILVFGWIILLGFFYFLTRIYIHQYEHWFTWRGRRQKLRMNLRNARTYEEWKVAASELDEYIGADKWKETDDFSYYDSPTIKKVVGEMRELRQKASAGDNDALETLGTLLQACVKHNFAGSESSRLYSQSYFGTKNRLQEFKDELEESLKFLMDTKSLSINMKRDMFKNMSRNYGRSALCLSGGACFAYYHFGVIRAHLDAGLIPSIITGTSGGGLIAALLATRTDEELKELVVPELATKITACHEGTFAWIKRWWRTGARFDAVDWAARSAWFTRGSMTFKEAYERTGRILNISCVPSDPNSPSILLNYITAPDCVIWSSLLASSAVPGILNPVVLMSKKKNGDIIPYSFGAKWKDGSIRTDIPIQSLNLHYNVNFPIVSQTNPHIAAFFFSTRGTVGQPVSHRKGRGWRGGFLGSALEQYLKLDLNKWLKVLRQLELLPRPMETDWSNLFLQRFYGSVNILPKTKLLDYYYILSDPSKERLARMIRAGETAAFPKLHFIHNRMKIERLIEKGRQSNRSKAGELERVLSTDDIAQIIQLQKKRNGNSKRGSPLLKDIDTNRAAARKSPVLPEEQDTLPTPSRFSPRSWFSGGNWSIAEVLTSKDSSNTNGGARRASLPVVPSDRRSSQDTMRPLVEPLTQDSGDEEPKEKKYFGGVGGEFASDTDGLLSEITMSEGETGAEDTGAEDTGAEDDTGAEEDEGYEEEDGSSAHSMDGQGDERVEMKSNMTNGGNGGLEMNGFSTKKANRKKENEPIREKMNGKTHGPTSVEGEHGKVEFFESAGFGSK